MSVNVQLAALNDARVFDVSQDFHSSRDWEKGGYDFVHQVCCRVRPEHANVERGGLKSGS